jgi:hypothetical protein
MMIELRMPLRPRSGTAWASRPRSSTLNSASSAPAKGPRDGPGGTDGGWARPSGSRWGQGEIRAADTDRDRVAGILSTAYSEGRLSSDEYDARLESALSARTYADLGHIVTDLPAAQKTVPSPAAPAMVTTSARTNGLAIASLACGLAQFTFGPLATIPAIVLGHMARSQIRRTGEQGAALALAGLVLGWGAVILDRSHRRRPGHSRRDAGRHAHALSSRDPRHHRGARLSRQARQAASPQHQASHPPVTPGITADANRTKNIRLIGRSGQRMQPAGQQLIIGLSVPSRAACFGRGGIR